jgi:glucose-6-phosphate dehydrogenase assembly protein OpcA
MATPVAPIVFDATGAWRWSARTDSIRGTMDALSRVWSRVAQEATEGETASDEMASAVARGDPRIGGRMRGDEDGVQVRTRTSVLTLIVMAPRPEDVDRAAAAVAALAARHPSRTVILSPTDPDGPAAFEAQVSASCQLPERGRSEICTEEVLIRLGGELAQHPSSTVAPLLIHDLPVVLWWPGDVPFARPDFIELVGKVDRLFIDSGHFRGNGLGGLIGLAGAVRDGVVVHDVSWMRLMLWRELLAACFDHPLLVRELRHLTSIRVDVARPGWDTRLSRAVLFVGWLLARLRLTVVRPLREAPTGAWEATLRSRGREVSVSIRPVEVEFSGAARTAGSVVRAELATARPDTRTTVTITRQADHLLATADWNGASVMRRASQLERFDEVPYLAGSLDRTSHERIFAQALEMAVALTGAEDTPMTTSDA